MRASSFLLAHVVTRVTWRTWSFEPGIVVSLVAVAVAYSAGTWRVWRMAGMGRGISRLEVLAFAAGWVALAVALMSPLDALSGSLFSAHMVQHELLMVIAAPLVVLGAPFRAFTWMLPFHPRRVIANAAHRRTLVAAIWTAATAPPIVWLAHAIALWAWHLPTLFDAAVRSDAVHAVQHLCFFGTAVLFWWGIAHGRYGRLGYGAAVVYVFTTALHSGVLGALLTFSPHVWYSAYASSSAAGQSFGLTPLEDQQLGGLVMWVPAGIVYIAVGLAFFAGWLRESERRVRVAPFVSFVGFVSLLSFVSFVACDDTYHTAAALTGGDPARGKQALTKYGCDTCHTIPGIRTARAVVGPPLTSVGLRVYLAGHLPNTPDNMQQWIQHPTQHEPHTAMPDVGVTEADARDMAAYLYTLR